jgi:hypothetical protein
MELDVLAHDGTLGGPRQILTDYLDLAVRMLHIRYRVCADDRLQGRAFCMQ